MGEWLAPEDDESKGRLPYVVRQALAAFGESLRIKFQLSNMVQLNCERLLNTKKPIDNHYS